MNHFPQPYCRHPPLVISLPFIIEPFVVHKFKDNFPYGASSMANNLNCFFALNSATFSCLQVDIDDTFSQSPPWKTSHGIKENFPIVVRSGGPSHCSTLSQNWALYPWLSTITTPPS